MGVVADYLAVRTSEAEALLEQPEALAPLLIAFRALPLSAHAAVTLELDGATSCLCLLAAGTRRPLNPSMHVLTTARQAAGASSPRGRARRPGTHARAHHGALSSRRRTRGA